MNCALYNCQKSLKKGHSLGLIGQHTAFGSYTENEFVWKFSYTMFGCELELELEFNDLNGLKQH